MSESTTNIKNKPNAFKNLISNLSGQTIWMVFAVLVIGITLLEPKFITSSNILNVLRQVSIVGLVSLGMTVVLIGGNFDLSTGAICHAGRRRIGQYRARKRGNHRTGHHYPP